MSRGKLLAAIFIILIFPMTALAQKAEKVPFKLQNPIPNFRTIWIGVLQGDWKEMGTQYGQRCGREIAWNFDIAWRDEVLKGSRGWQQGKNEKEKGQYCAAYMERCVKELSYLSPEMVDFFQGIADGSADQLAKCKYASACSNLTKIALLNFSGIKLHPNWDFKADRPGLVKIGKAGKVDGHECNGFWVKGSATTTGEAFAIRHTQDQHIRPGGSGRETLVSYVAIPKDPNAYVFWGCGRAGNVGGGSGAGVMNDQGVAVLTSGAQYKEGDDQADETLAPGIKDFWLASYGVIFSKTAKEAAEKVTVGNERYRKLTGRKTVLRARGADVVFVDPNEAYCVEANARHYAIRKPGDMGEKDGNFIVNANHFKYAKGSFDENNVFQPGQPMTMYCPEKEKEKDSSYYRFWSGMWAIQNNYGKIDKDMIMRDIGVAHYAFDKDGKRYDVDPETGAPTVPGTFCAHDGPFTKQNPLGLGGSNATTFYNLSTLEVWNVPVWPCHYKEWDLSWTYCNLKPYSEMRKLARSN